MYHVWISVDDDEVLFKAVAVSRGAAVQQARAAYPAGAIVSVLPV